MSHRSMDVLFICLLLRQAFAVPEAIARFRGFGGVRLEDSVLVTANGARNLTTCPRTADDVEKIRAGLITDKGLLQKLL